MENQLLKTGHSFRCFGRQLTLGEGSGETGERHLVTEERNCDGDRIRVISGS